MSQTTPLHSGQEASSVSLFLLQTTPGTRHAAAPWNPDPAYVSYSYVHVPLYTPCLGVLGGGWLLGVQESCTWTVPPIPQVK